MRIGVTGRRGEKGRDGEGLALLDAHFPFGEVEEKVVWKGGGRERERENKGGVGGE